MLVLAGLTTAGCSGRSRRAPSGLVPTQQQQPRLSGDGSKLAVIADQRGRPTVQVRDLKSGQLLQLRHFSRHQPHSSPSLSWNGRYLAAVIQRGNRRLVLIEDRLTGRAHPLRLPAGRNPVNLSLAPDGRELAVQTAEQGRWQVEVFNLSELLESDRPGGRRETTAPEEP